MLTETLLVVRHAVGHHLNNGCLAIERSVDSFIGAVAAWEQLGLLPIEKVPLWAAYWIAAGSDGRSLAELACLHGDDPHDVHDLLPATLNDFGVSLAGSAVAAIVACTHVARLFSDGLAGPQWVLQNVAEIAALAGYRRASLICRSGRSSALLRVGTVGGGRPAS